MSTSVKIPVEAPAPRSARVPASLVLIVACFGAFLAFLDATIVNVAFPSMRASFPDSSIGTLSWVLNAYNIVFAACLIVFGRLTDLLGRRRAFVGGVAVFTAASVLCGLAPGIETLVAFRMLQAVGAAMIVPASLALVVAAYPSGQRAHAIGAWGASAAVAAGLGPPIGGLLVEAGGWRWAFLINLPFGLVGLVLARRLLVESRAPGRRRMPDVLGAALLTAALGTLNLAIIKGPDWGWGSAAVIGTFTGAALLAALFVISSRRHREPLLDPAVLRQRAFTVGSLATIAAGFGFFAYLLTNILWLQYVWQYSVIEAGLALVPAAVVAAVVASRLGPLAARYGYRRFIVPGALVWAGSYVWYHQMVGTTPAFWAEWFPGQVLSGIGAGAVLPLLGSVAMASIPGGRYATASAVVSSARQLGGVLGISVLVVVVGDLAPGTAVSAFRDGWLLSVLAFVVVAIVSMGVGRPVEAVEETEPTTTVAARILAPEPPESWAPREAAVTLHGALAALPAEARRRLEHSMRPAHVPAGRYLLRQGDPAGSAYAIQSGRLEVEVDGTVVRELGPGDVLGELALLTGEARSASVRARRDSTVVELPRRAFENLLQTDPPASRAMLGQLAEQLRTAGGPVGPRPPQRVTVISVVSLTPAAPVEAVAAELVAALSRHLRVAAPGRIGPTELERAERDHDRVVIVAGDDSSPEWRKFCLRQADTVVLVGRSDARISPVPLLPSPARQPELVLVGAHPPHSDRARWVAATDAWDLTLVGGDLSVDLRPLAARLAGRSVGLVLGGGGARGLAHVGVLRELEDAGIQVDRIAGTSVGAMIASGHAAGLDGAGVEESSYAEFVRHRPFSDWHLPAQSLVRGRRVHAGLMRTVGKDSVIEGLPRQLWMVSVDLMSRTRQVHRRGNAADAALASSRLPMIFAPLPQDDGRLLVDGAVLDNLPVDLLVQRDEGPVIAVNIGSGSGGSPRSGPPRVPGIGDTMMRTMLISGGGSVGRARRHGAWVINTSSMGVGLLEFHQMDVLVEHGRAAARALLEQCDGDLGVLGQAVVTD